MCTLAEKKAAAERKEPAKNEGGANDKDAVEKDTEDEMLETTATVLDDVANKV